MAPGGRPPREKLPSHGAVVPRPPAYVVLGGIFAIGKVTLMHEAAGASRGQQGPAEASRGQQKPDCSIQSDYAPSL